MAASELQSAFAIFRCTHTAQHLASPYNLHLIQRF